MVRLGFFCQLFGRARVSLVLLLTPTTLDPSRKQIFGEWWNPTQALLLQKPPLKPIDHGSLGNYIPYKTSNPNKTSLDYPKFIATVRHLAA